MGGGIGRAPVRLRRRVREHRGQGLLQLGGQGARGVQEGIWPPAREGRRLGLQLLNGSPS